MKCKKCGELIEGFAFKCPVCGASLAKDDNSLGTMVNPVHSHWEDCSVDSHPGAEEAFSDAGTQYVPRGPVGFLPAIRLFFLRAFDFKGRSRRSEYWWATLFVYGANLLLTSLSPELGGFLTLLLFVPCLALCVRRLHDTGKSGWWYFLICVPFGALVLLFFFCMDSGPDNRYGTSPKY